VLAKNRATFYNQIIYCIALFLIVMSHITSLTNPFIKFICTLHERKGREASGKFIAEGIRTCSTLLASKITCEKLIATEEMLPQVQDMVHPDLLVVVTPQVMRKISTSTTPSGVIGLFAIPVQSPLSQLTAGLVLAEVMDPGNMGTLIRSAVAFGCTSIVLIGGVDPWNPKVVQASAGCMGNIALFELSWDDFYEYATCKKYEIIALVVSGGEDARSIHYSSHHFLMVGGEANGIPQAWIDASTRRVTLPMPGPTESLNVAIAGALALAVVYWQQIPIVSHMQRG
jgi:TrmH family RNA methyltransferase